MFELIAQTTQPTDTGLPGLFEAIAALVGAVGVIWGFIQRLRAKQIKITLAGLIQAIEFFTASKPKAEGKAIKQGIQREAEILQVQSKLEQAVDEVTKGNGNSRV